MLILEAQDHSVLSKMNKLGSALTEVDKLISLKEAITWSQITAGEAKRECNNRITGTPTSCLHQTTEKKAVPLEIIKVIFKAVGIDQTTGMSNQSIRTSIPQLTNSTNNKAHRKTLTHHNSQATRTQASKRLKACIKNKILEHNLRECPSETTAIEIRMEIILHFQDPQLRITHLSLSSKALINK